LTRRRSMTSNASIASTAELTSDGGLTSPARTNTPSPPFPNTTFTSFAPYSLAAKSVHPPRILVPNAESKDAAHLPEIVSASPKAEPVADAAPRKRCITFMCDAKKETKPKATPAVVQEPTPTATNPGTSQPRRCTIKFACPGPERSVKDGTSCQPAAQAVRYPEAFNRPIPIPPEKTPPPRRTFTFPPGLTIHSSTCVTSRCASEAEVYCC
jgi:hypothetical protein